MIKIEYIYKKNDTKNTKYGSCVLCIILYFYRIFKIRVFCICQPWAEPMTGSMGVTVLPVVYWAPIFLGRGKNTNLYYTK